MKLLYIISSLFFLGLFSSCEKTFTPKPKGYHRIDLPERKYLLLDSIQPFSFEYSYLSKIEKHVSHDAEPNWVDVNYPTFGATIQLTYKDLTIPNNNLNELIDDAHRLTSKHQVKAFSIEEELIKTPRGYYAHIFELQGEVPSQFQFYTTDSSKHFLRGALYFKTGVKNDSLAPVIEYIKQDVINMLNTLKWKK